MAFSAILTKCFCRDQHKSQKNLDNPKEPPFLGKCMPSKGCSQSNIKDDFYANISKVRKVLKADTAY